MKTPPATSTVSIHFNNGRPSLKGVPHGSNLMQVLLAAQVPVASSCGGDGVCGKCKIEVISGASNLSAPSELEIFLKERHDLRPAERISCQTRIFGDVTVNTSYW